MVMQRSGGETHIVDRVNVRARSLGHVGVDKSGRCHPNLSQRTPHHLNMRTRPGNKLTETIRSRSSVVRAAISASVPPRFHPGELLRNQPYIRRQSHINVVLKHGKHAARRVASHVLVEERQNRLVLGAVLGEDVLRAQEAALLTAVEVELDGVGRGEASLGEDAQRFENNDGAGSVVVGTGASGGGATCSGIEVRPDDNWGLSVAGFELSFQSCEKPTEIIALAGKRCDDRKLVEAVLELGHGNLRVGCGYLLNLLKEPFGGLCACGSLVVAVEVAAVGQF